jgi:propanol-preferring alcohol dehydrogenase
MDEIEGRLPPPNLPVIPGHQVVGHVVACGDGVPSGRMGERVGVAWIFSACGQCDFCQRGDENLCPDYRATGCDANGGYAQLMTVPAMFAIPLPDALSDSDTAPLLCAGAIGYRSLRLTGLSNGQRLGLTGFGASGHLVLKLVRRRYPEMSVFVFARNRAERAFALEMGAVWAGDIADRSPAALHAIIDTTPVWKPVVEALANLAPGGRLVINAIRKEGHDREALRRLDYATHLWQEKEIKSVANVTRADVIEFLGLAAVAGIRPDVEAYDLADANRALVDLKWKRVRGAKVLRIG